MLIVRSGKAPFEECVDCHFHESCAEGNVEYCEIRDGGEPPKDAVCYDLESGEELCDCREKNLERSNEPNKERSIYLDSEISKRSVLPIIKEIMKYNKEDNDISPDMREPIKLYISCDGGEEVAGNALIDVMEQSLTPIHAIGVGSVYSMAALVFLAAHKRFAFSKSEFLIHDGMCDSAENPTAKLYDTIDFIRKRNDRIRDYILERTSIPGELYDAKYREDWYLFADEAKQLGIVDNIIGKDADLYDVI